MTDLAETLQKEGHYTEAEKLQREILDHVRTIFGTDSPQLWKHCRNWPFV
jgi:hypothetical protein